MVREMHLRLRLADELVYTEVEADPDERVVARSLRARGGVGLLALHNAERGVACTVRRCCYRSLRVGGEGRAIVDRLRDDRPRERGAEH